MLFCLTVPLLKSESLGFRPLKVLFQSQKADYQLIHVYTVNVKFNDIHLYNSPSHLNCTWYLAWAAREPSLVVWNDGDGEWTIGVPVAQPGPTGVWHPLLRRRRERQVLSPREYWAPRLIIVNLCTRENTVSQVLHAHSKVWYSNINRYHLIRH